MSITFHVEEIDFDLPHEESHLISWLNRVAHEHGQSIAQLTYIFCSDDYLLAINQNYLQHDYYTDIITFPYEATEGALMGDVFISVDRIQDNAAQYGTPFAEELYRVIVHGLLHLIGFNDKTEDEAQRMRQQEDLHLQSAPHVSRET